MPFTIIRNDITKLGVDAIVNAADAALQMDGGVYSAIFKAAGADKLQKVCDKLAPIETGGAVITPGFDLPAKHKPHNKQTDQRYLQMETQQIKIESAPTITWGPESGRHFSSLRMDERENRRIRCSKFDM